MNRTLRQATRCAAWQNTQSNVSSICTRRPFHTTINTLAQSTDSTSVNPPVSVTASNARLSKLGVKLSLMRPAAIINSSSQRARRKYFLGRLIDPNARVSKPIYRAKQSADKLDNYTMNVGMIVERLPRYLNPPPSWQVQYENQLAAERQRRIVPVPAMLVPDVPTETVTEKQLVDIETEQDRSDDRHSLDRVQNDSLYLLVKHSNGQWTLPQQPYDSTKHQQLSLEKAARRIVLTVMGDSLQVHALGFAPVAMHRHEPSVTGSDASGSKLFIYHGVVVSGNVSRVGEYSDYAWVTKSHLAEYIKDSSLLTVLRDVLITDSDLAEHDKRSEQSWTNQNKQRQAHA